MCTMKRRDHTWVTWQSNWLPGRQGTNVIKNIPVCSTRLLNVSWLAVIRGVEQMYCFWSGIIGTLVMGTFLASGPPVLWWPVLCDVPRSWLSAVIRRAGSCVGRLEIKGARCPAACMLFKESILDFSTSLLRLRVDWSVTNAVSRYSALAWGEENSHELANTQCSRTAGGQGRARLGKLAHLSHSKVPRASTEDYFKLLDYCELRRRACNVLALSFCSALLPSPAQPYRPSFQ